MLLLDDPLAQVYFWQQMPLYNILASNVMGIINRNLSIAM